MKTRLVGAAVALLLAAAAVTGCAPEPEPAEPTPAFTSEAEAFAAAEETYRAYVDALNQVDLSDPETFEDVFAWTTGDLNATDRQGLSEYHAEGVTVSGDSVIALLDRASIDLEAVRADLNVCLDVAAVEVLNATGESLVDPNRTNVQSLSIALAGSAKSPTLFLVESIGPREGEPACD